MPRHMPEYLTDIRRVAKVLDRATERKLAWHAKRGDMASRERLIASQLRFGYTLAQKYTGRGIDLDDLVAVANVGVVWAVDKFRLKEQTRLTTIVYWAVTRRLRAYCHEHGSLIRFPACANMTEELVERANAIRNAGVIKVGAVGGAEFDGEFEPEDRSIGPSEHVADAEHEEFWAAMVDEALGQLPFRDAAILRLRYFDKLGLEEIGDMYGLSKERIRQIEARGIERLRGYFERHAAARSGEDAIYKEGLRDARVVKKEERKRGRGSPGRNANRVRRRGGKRRQGEARMGSAG